MITGSNIF